MPHYKFIDGLRGLSIVLVVIFHAFPYSLPGGFIGVDVFFVISGFLITSIIWEKIQTNKFSFVEFYIARIRRLIPAAIVVYTITFIFAFYILMPELFREFGRSLTSSVLFYSNHYFYLETDYFSAPALQRPLLHTWSLSVEEQFYIIWPLVIFTSFYFMARYMPRTSSKLFIVVLSIVILLSSLTYAQYLIPIDKSKAFYLITARAWELMLGGVLALTITNIVLSRRYAEILSGLGLIFIISSAISLNKSSAFPGLAALPACLGTAFIICACIKHKTFISRFLSLRPLIFLGLISYSFYLWHWPALSLSYTYLERHLLFFELILVILVTIIASYLSWKYIEQPFRQKKSKFFLQKKQAFQIVVPSLCILAILGLTIYGFHGWPWRLDGKIRDVYQQMAKANDKRKSCDGFSFVFKNDEYCNFGIKKHSDTSYDIAVFGDSKADHYVPMLSKYAQQLNLSGRQVTQAGGCGALLEVKRKHWKAQQQENCINLQKKFIEFVRKNPDLKLVVLSASWGGFSNDDYLVPYSLDLPEFLHKTILDQGIKPGMFEYHLKLTVNFLLNQNIAVHLIGDIPSYKRIGGLPLRCIRTSFKKNEKPNCGIPIKYKDQLQRSNELFESLAQDYENVTAFIPTKILCDDKICRVMIDNTFLYRDLGHLNAYGSRKLLEHANIPEILSKTEKNKEKH